MTNLREPRTEAGRRLLNAPHVVEFSRTGYGLQHPISCRPDLLGCKLNKWLARQSQPVCAPGRYLMAGIGRFQSLPPDYTDPLVPDAILAIENEAAAPVAALIEAVTALTQEVYVPHESHLREEPDEYDVELLAPQSATVERVLTILSDLSGRKS